MRLAKIKLAGFKSFVDPTSLVLPSNLVGIVGPNGCGKSNIIDAIRWVMGESSAKHLRGDSMADVIFNGSNTRQPVGQATIELMFDNSEGLLGGQYAEYNEISVRRQVSRDGQSSYFLNGVRCRRRDIMDVFLGTGLGPRSYAIIEQGMISRVIEAKPEELRGFIEEAAGISKYKERRRETENRMRHTEENLARLGDVRDELDKQLQRLQRQARNAEKYKEMKAEERRLKAELTVLRWQALDRRDTEEQRRVRELETAYERLVAAIRDTESEMEQRREAHVEANDAFNAVQSRYYGVGADVARLEQAIQHLRERREQLERESRRAAEAVAEADSHISDDRRQLAELVTLLERDGPRLEALRGDEAAEAEALGSAESALREWQERWEVFNQDAAEKARQAEVERTRIHNLDQGLDRLRSRRQRLEGERGGLGTDGLEQELAQLRERLQQAQGEQQRLDDQTRQAQGRGSELREQGAELANQLHAARQGLEQARGRLASLEALQEQVLAKGGAVAAWLAARDVAGERRLAEALTVEPGWERAVETVLGHHLEAVCTERFAAAAAAVDEFEQGMLGLVDSGVVEETATASDGLLSKVAAPWMVGAMMAGVRTADTLDAALALRPSLAVAESVVCPEGVWLGRNWLRVNRSEESGAGVLAREQAMRELHREITAHEERVGEVTARQEAVRGEQGQVEGELRELQQALREAQRQASATQSQVGAREAHLERARQRLTAIDRELEEIGAEQARNEQVLAASRGELQGYVEAMERHAAEREGLARERDGLRGAVDDARRRHQAVRDETQQLALRLESARSRRESLEQGIARATRQSEVLAARVEEVKGSLAEMAEPMEQTQGELEQKLAQRLAVEGELRDARARVEALDHEMRELAGRRSATEQEAEGARGELEQARMGQQEIRVRKQGLLEALEAEGQEREQVEAALPQDAAEGPWSEALEALGQRIARLGPINLAAIEEYDQESERKQYLDAQHEDLTEALETLLGAMRKIDRETRTRFKETFEQVDAGMKELFPMLFGGGHAYLELTSDDLLETGVTVMARPPGKRNSSIHLLSGGEKALTAVALVFSIFKLNPAPFCLLDEVDAPLDDANVSRFCDLVRSMSDRVQFMIISHNKLTMELTDFLVGVTMNEPGVSRLVAVDVEAALEMAAS
ncbi:MAG: chromosome segregation protein SMC [Gammaproteobacteria bacterium]|nr:chromosome segregation protein SMC [Gammaproteobacteria bacterium]